jgi:hypothetical protein
VSMFTLLTFSCPPFSVMRFHPGYHCVSLCVCVHLACLVSAFSLRFVRVRWVSAFCVCV